MGPATLRERILADGAPAVVLRGPAACGKTAAAVDLYTHFARPTGAACLLIVPNAAAARRLRRRLVAEAPGGAVASPGVLTFAGLAGRILAAADDPARLLSPFARRRLLRRIVDELAATDGLAALGASADTPGLIASLDRSIAELKRAAVEPDDLAGAVGRADAKGLDLAAVYRRYQQTMRADGVYDLEGQMWQARDRLADRRGLAALDGVEAVAVDGFTDFTPTQLAILALLAPRLRCVLVTLPYDEDGRPRLWYWTGRTLDALRREFGEDLREIALTAPVETAPAAPPPLRTLWDRVFQFDAPSCPPPDGFGIISAAGADAEVAGVATRIKRLLTDGAGPGRIAVLARDLTTYREPIERIFGECDIPVAAAPRALASEPIVRFALDVATLPAGSAAQAFASDEVLRTISSSYFRPSAVGAFDGATVAVAQTMIRQANVLQGREAYAAAAERLALRADHRAEDADDEADADAPNAAPCHDADALRAAAAMLDAMFDIAERSRRDGLGAVVEALALHRAAEAQPTPELAARDLRALAALESALDEADDATDPAALAEALAPVTSPPPRREALVDVLDVLDARPLRYAHVFLLGVGEGQFPRGFNDSALLSEAQREAWAARGVALDSRRDLNAREMLLFYLAVSRTERTLTLTYMDSDAGGRAGAPGSFLHRLVAPVGDDAGRGLDAPAVAARTERIAPGRFLTPAEALTSRRDARVAAAAGAFDTNCDAANGALAWLGAHEPRTPARAARGVWTLHRREAAGCCDAYDGRIVEADLRATLRRRYGPEAIFSAAQLNTYGQCPWRFFAAYVLRLEPPPEPQRRLEPVASGVFCHNVLFRTFTTLRDEAGGPVRLCDLRPERVDAALVEAVAAESAAVEARRPPWPALWKLQRDAMHADLARYLRDAAQPLELDGAAAHFELGFGLGERRDAEARDPASRDEPVTIATPAGPLRLRGKIDRVDCVGFADRRGAFVVDYKTGRLPAAGDIPAGRSLQLPLYAAAVEELLGEPALGGAFHRVAGGREPEQRVFASFAPSGGEYRPNEAYGAASDEALRAAARFTEGIRDGRFDLLPTHDCPSWCPYRQICHFAPWRVERKTSSEEPAR
ncbi:MAG: PD-(D/E)XK nuclease family protein [Planctomycetota bacterium]